MLLSFIHQGFIQFEHFFSIIAESVGDNLKISAVYPGIELWSGYDFSFVKKTYLFADCSFSRVSPCFSLAGLYFAGNYVRHDVCTVQGRIYSQDFKVNRGNNG